MTLLDWLLEKYPDTPKKRAKQWIMAGRVSVNGVVIRQPHAAVEGAVELLDRRQVSLPVPFAIHPRLTLLHLDAALAVVDKAPSLLSVPADNFELSALSILTDVLAGKLRVDIPAAYRRLKPLPVHRLDQFTSGVFCIAMNPDARAKLIDQLQAHTMRREYIAFVEGRPKQPTGTWRNKLKLSDDQLRQFVAADGEESITHYEVIAEYVGVTKLRLRLETGRRHQIRVQAAHAGLPLVGDRVYNPDGRIRFDRQALHAETLSLVHPDTGKQMTFTAPLPKDLQQLEASLR
jgi:23S rRNA pseudouridine1911/1915/1917 synthase